VPVRWKILNRSPADLHFSDAITGCGGEERRWEVLVYFICKLLKKVPLYEQYLP
jgi:hypothetical protein